MTTYRITTCPNSEKIAQAVLDNDGYCPCKTVKDETTKCMCLEFRTQFMGPCSCGLYEKIPADYILFTKSGCPRCEILKKEIERNNKVFIESEDYPEGYTDLPVLMDPAGKLYTFRKAMALFASKGAQYEA